MKDGIFKSGNPRARAAEVMSTKSENDFKWSVKLVGEYGFEVGIASVQLNQENDWISWCDRNAVLYSSCNCESGITIGKHEIHKDLPEHKKGDVIRFRFQPQRKKLVIDLVRI